MLVFIAVVIVVVITSYMQRKLNKEKHRDVPNPLYGELNQEMLLRDIEEVIN